MYNPYVVGKLVYLRHPSEEDALGNWHEWFSDEEITKNLADRFWPNSKESQLQFVKLLGDKRKLVLSVVTTNSDKHIGVVSLSSINWVHRFADVAIVIGDKEFRKGVYSVEAFGLILKVAFVRLNLKTVKSLYLKSNDASRMLHRVFKFIPVGELKDIFFINGHYENVVIEMLDQESWVKRNL
ncbi:MAG: GNAT family N-acetyltransferase [Deltaproteobacteria bacterium]|nr:GNAT family N-acetyltransferase [Deltaproteobacteria bacterium]